MLKAKKKADNVYHLGIQQCNLEVSKLQLKLKEEAKDIGDATEYNQVVQGVLINYIEIIKDGYLFYVSYRGKSYIYTVPDIKLTANVTLKFKKTIDKMLESKKNERKR
ncbi:hypothetical protein FNU2_22 [Fusobacterium phage vB_FnuS_FNU2]|nr:hypothetical protein FNU2_22 [Fusobacterium phage vB_FnuS_FNU2]